MPSRPDLRDLAANVKDAFGEMDRETLLDILTFVVKEYVVEGPPPMLVHQAETLADLQGLTFAQLIQALQTRFDHPELSMFAVDGDQVSVRVGGVMQPLLAARQPMGAGTGTQPGGGAAELPRPQAGVRVVETNVQQRPAAPVPAQTSGSAPPPTRGVSLRGRPQGEAAGEAPPQQQQVQQPPAAAPQGQQPPAQGQPGAPEQKDKPEGSGDDASARFSLLELD
jgi:hypothetical protein